MTKLPSEKLNPVLIALDLDDTLLTKDLTIGPKTVKALQNCASRGIYIVPCSGRAENGILPFVRVLNIAGTQAGRFIIAMNGSTIFDLHKRETIYSRKVNADVLTFAYEEAIKRGFACQVYNSDTTFANVDNEFSRMDAKLCHLNLKVVDDFKSFLQTGHTKMLIPGKENEVAEFQKFLSRELGDRAVVFTSKPYFLEIMPPNVGKGEAIEYLCQYLQIPLEKAMSFGDSMNDETMIRMCGYSVGMSNGLEYIQDCAKFVTRLSNNEDGIGDFLNEFVF